MAQQTANEALLDALIRHQTYLLRYSGSVRNRIWNILDKTERDIADRIQKKLAGTTGLTTPVELRRMQALLAQLDTIRRTAWGEATEYLLTQMVDLSYQEPIAMQAIAAAAAPVVIETVLPAARLLKSIALSRPFEGRILKDWAATMEAEDIRRIHSAIQLGMVAGETTDAIVRRVVGSTALKGTDGITELTRRQVQAITRTAIQHVANNARNEFMLENAEVMTAEQFVATLDARTTPICRANDGKRFPVGKGPIPPLHFACRSLRVAAFDEGYIGQRPAKPVTQNMLLREFGEQEKIGLPKSRDDLPKGFKGKFDEFARKRTRELTGRVPATETYQTWLKRQSKEFQDDTLGKTKAKLFREGGLTLDKFVAANGSELTLAQLASKYSGAFRTAGLNPDDF